MSDTDPQSDTSPTTFSVVDSGWYESDELIEKLGTSRRTFFRMINRGEVEKRETPSGMRYRPADPEALKTPSTDTETPGAKQGASGTNIDGSAKCRHCQVPKNGTSEVVSVSLEDWSELQRKAGKLELLEAENRELKSARARLYVAEGRQDLAEERLQRKADELAAAKEENERLRKLLEEQKTPKKRSIFDGLFE